jgi:hypothetical protein
VASAEPSHVDSVAKVVMCSSVICPVAAVMKRLRGNATATLVDRSRRRSRPAIIRPLRCHSAPCYHI